MTLPPHELLAHAREAFDAGYAQLRWKHEACVPTLADHYAPASSKRFMLDLNWPASGDPAELEGLAHKIGVLASGLALQLAAEEEEIADEEIDLKLVPGAWVKCGNWKPAVWLTLQRGVVKLWVLFRGVSVMRNPRAA